MKKLLLSLFIISVIHITAQTSSTFSFNVNGSSVPAGLVSALNSAGDRWGNYLIITEPVKVNIFLVNNSQYPFSAITLANGRKNFTNAPFSNFIYPTALANQLAGTELNPGEYDMDIYVNLATPMYYGTGMPSGSQDDFITLIMHEIGHGLGFYSAGYVNSGNIGSFGNIPASALFPITASFPWHGQDSVPSIYDKFIIKKSQNHLVGLAPNNTTILGDSIKYTSNYFDGPNFANPSNGGQPIKLSGGTGTFTLGVDLLHLHSSVCGSIMSYCWGAGDTIRRPAYRELGILKEIGWNTTANRIEESLTNNSDDLYPNPAQNFVEVSGSNIHSVVIYDMQGRAVIQEVNYRKSNNFKINTENIPNGIYFIAAETENNKKLITKKLVILH